MSRSKVAAALAAFCMAVAAQPSPIEKPSPGAWRSGAYVWLYNPADAPAWLAPGDAKQMMIDASRAWEVCGVRMEYAGETQLVPGDADGVNVVGWRRAMLPGVRGITSGRQREGELIERDIVFASGREEFQRNPALLRKVLVHEFGHAIGLTHSSQCDDVMALAAECAASPPRELPQSPTPRDIERCEALYPAGRR